MRSWLGIALLAVSWLLGLQYYHQIDWVPWSLAKAVNAVWGIEMAVQTASAIVCGILILLGAALLCPAPPREARPADPTDPTDRTDRVSPTEGAAGRILLAIALALLLPAIWVAPWPYRAAPLLLAIGLALRLLPIPRPWATRLASGAVAAGIVLLGQALTMLAYASLTARSHELPWPLPHLLAAIASLLGADVAVNGSTLTVWSMRLVNPFAATWELLVDPPSLCFLVGGLLLLLYRAVAERPGPQVPAPAPQPKIKNQKSKIFSPFVVLLLCVVAWLPLRAGLFLALYLHRLLRTEYEAYLELMNQFWNPWVHLLLLLPLVLLAWRFVRLRDQSSSSSTPPPGSTIGGRQQSATPAAPAFRLLPTAYCLLPTALFGFAVAAFSVAIYWDPVGVRKPGRILMDEHHSTWEPTQRPFDTTWYGHDSGYNYACIYDYLSRFYPIQRLTAAIGEETLDNCDVLIVKVPTERYTPDEVAAIVAFVRRGGGLLLVGEHTDVFNTGTGLNDIARHFGFSFRFDCLFGVDTIFDDLFLQPLVPHPVIQNMPRNDPRVPCFDLAVSASVAPGLSSGRAVMLDWGLKQLGCDYHALNYYPQVEDRPDMRYGAFVQLWATRAGAGRVVAHTDSTEFSNFCTFEPGKAELMLGMVEWLNHRNTFNATRPLLILLSLILLAGGLFLAWRELKISNCQFSIFNSFLLLSIAAGLCGWAFAATGVRAAQRAAMPLPKNTEPLVHVVIDRTVCDGPLSKSGFIGGRPDGFGIFERWILRLGYFISRRADADAFRGDALVFFSPNHDPDQDFLDGLARYVEKGGKVLILDSPENAKSTSNSLLWLFDPPPENTEPAISAHGLPRTPTGLRVNHQPVPNRGVLTPPRGWPAVPVASACEVTGGTPLIRLNGRPVAASIRYGAGLVVVIGFGSRFSDANMGVTGDVVPNPELTRVYNLQYALLRALIGDKLP